MRLPRPTREGNEPGLPGIPSLTREQARLNQAATARAQGRARSEAAAAIEHGTTTTMAGRCKRLHGAYCQPCREVRNAADRARRAAARPAWRDARPRSGPVTS